MNDTARILTALRVASRLPGLFRRRDLVEVLVARIVHG